MDEPNDRYLTGINAIDKAVPADENLTVDRVGKFRDKSPAIRQRAQRRRCLKSVANKADGC